MSQGIGIGSGKYERLLARCKDLAPVPTAVAYPCELTALSGAMEAAALGLIKPLLVGPAARIREIAISSGIDLDQAELVDVPQNDAATKAVELIREGRAEILMKGSLHTDELMSAIVSRERGLRTGRRISHAFVMDVTYHKVLIVTMVRSILILYWKTKWTFVERHRPRHLTGVEKPKVPSWRRSNCQFKDAATLDAAALCKMADREQIKAACWMDTCV